MTEGTATEAAPERLRRLSGARLARLAGHGSRAAFTIIYHRHHREIHRYCCSLVGNEHDAYDALQNTMLRAFRGLQGERRDIAVRPWLFRIAHNESMSLLRARKHQAPVDPTQVGVAEPSTDPEAREELRDLVADLELLTHQQRSALLMREVGGLRFGEIGTALETSPNAAKQAVYEARVALHEIADGREMSCEEVRRKLSAEDRRLLRARRVRAHLRACDDCSRFKGEIAARRVKFAGITPPFSIPAVLALLRSTLGGAGAATGAGGVTGGTTTMLGAAALKAGVVAVVVGAGAYFGGVGVQDRGQSDLDRPGAPAHQVEGRLAHARTPTPTLHRSIGAPDVGASTPSGDRDARLERGAEHNQVTPAGASARGTWSGTPADDTPVGASSGSGQASGSPSSAPTAGQDGLPADGGGGTDSASPAQPPASPAVGADASPGASGSAPGHGATPPGQGGTPPGQAQTPPGQGGTPPGQAQTPPGQGGTPPGQAQTPPGQGGTPPGQAQTPPGQGGTPPGQAQTPPGQGGTPPGQAQTPPGQGGTPPGQARRHPPGGTPPGQGGTPPGHH